jgi:hypothetical protein
MADGWRWETAVAAGCVGLFLAGRAAAGSPLDEFWTAVLAAAVGAGLGFGLAGSRRGSRNSRSVAQGCLLLHTVFALLLATWTKAR